MKKNILAKKIKNKDILSVDLDGDINSLVYARKDNSGINLRGLKVIELIGVRAEEKEDYLTQEIVRALKEFQVSARGVYVSFRGPSLCLGRHILPPMPTSEIPNALLWQVKGKVSFPPEEIILDFDFIKQVQETDGTRSNHYLLAFAQNKEVEEVCNFMEKCKLHPVKINISPFSNAHLLNLARNLEMEKIYAILELGWQSSNISFYRQKKLIFPRIIPTGIKSFIHTLQTSIVYNGNHISLTEEKAYKALKEVGIPDGHSGEWEGFPLSQLTVLMRPGLERLSMELNRSLQYFSSTLNEGDVEKIFVSGIGSAISGMVKFLSQNTSLPIEPLKVETSGITVSSRDSAIAGPAIGNMLARSSKANLLPKEYRLAEIRGLKNVLCTGSVIISIFFLVFSFTSISKTMVYNRRLPFFRKQKESFAKLKKIDIELKARLKAETLIREGDINFSWVLKEISRIMPSNVMLSEFNLDNEKRLLELKGIIFYTNFPENTLTTIIRQIEGSLILKDGRLDAMRKNPDSPDKTEFKLIIGLR